MRLIAIALLGLLATGLAGCQSPEPSAQSAVMADITTSGNPADVVTNRTETLGVGDTIRLTVFGEDTLSGEFPVDASGNVVLPLIGSTPAAGKSPDQLTADIRKALNGPYLVDPKVSVAISQFRPIYVLGEVQRPGEYPYRNGQSVISAIASAEGYTYRANRSKVTIDRPGTTGPIQTQAGANVPVLPGDVITVPERWF